MASAILMAAGMGTRMRPLTEHMPKPLVKVYGTPMIETIIRALKAGGVRSIYIVVGYLKEQFSYLTAAYEDITLIENTEYRTINNISSLHAVGDVLGQDDCFICEADLYLPAPEVLRGTPNTSCYYGKWVEGQTDDWCFRINARGEITRIGKGGTDCYNMVGISFLKAADAAAVRAAIREAYGRPGYETLFWDEVVDRMLPRLRLTIHPVERGQIVEIDSVDELCALDPSYRTWKEENE